MNSVDLEYVRPIVHEFEQICLQQLVLCETLEDVADRIGATPGSQCCMQAARAIGPLMRRVHLFKEEQLFPLMQHMAANDHDFANSIDQLKFEHYEDESFAEEVYEALMDFGRGASRMSGDAIGYLLRGFFMCLRRHIAFEREVLRSALVRLELLDSGQTVNPLDEQFLACKDCCKPVRQCDKCDRVNLSGTNDSATNRR